MNSLKSFMDHVISQLDMDEHYERVRQRGRRRQRRRRLAAGLVAAGLAVTTTVVLARAFWPGPNGEQRQAGQGVATGGRDSGREIPQNASLRAERLGQVDAQVKDIAHAFDSIWISGWIPDATGSDIESFIERRSSENGEFIARIPAPTTGWVTGGGNIAAGLDRLWLVGDEYRDGVSHAEIISIHPNSNEVETRIDLGEGQAGGLAVADDGSVWASVVARSDDGSESSRAFRVDPFAERADLEFDLGPIRAQRLAVVEGHLWAWGAVYERGNLVDVIAKGINAVTGEEIRTLSGISGIASDGSELWVASWTSDGSTLEQIDPATGARLGDPIDLDMGVGPTGMGMEDDSFWFVSRGPRVVLVDLSRRTVVDSVLAGGGVSLAAETQAAWTLSIDGTVYVVEIQEEKPTPGR